MDLFLVPPFLKETDSDLTIRSMSYSGFNGPDMTVQEGGQVAPLDELPVDRPLV